ncbi:maltodextrose utilization protein MalA, partial [Enterococcus faecium]
TKSQLSSIQTFKESPNWMLNVMGIGSLAAAVVGFIHFDFILMLSVQTTITVLLLLWVFVKTRFKDKRVE